MVTLIIREFISSYLDASTAIFITNINYLASSSFLVSQLIILGGDNVQKSNFFYLI